ncbi:hypothetical protein [Salinigranum sp.]|uniref:hypothetical protein n=1 Tax=Salinigranum sp. TaxID=1966351 RepID=UPI003569FFAF
MTRARRDRLDAAVLEPLGRVGRPADVRLRDEESAAADLSLLGRWEDPREGAFGVDSDGSQLHAPGCGAVGQFDAELLADATDATRRGCRELHDRRTGGARPGEDRPIDGGYVAQ